MAVLKCKMCGGTLEINQSETVATCEYCGTQQTLPRLDNDKKINLYDRANHFRRNNEFDKAMGIYEQILNEDITDAETYWSLVLCRYGIEYVEDPSTHKMVPTVNRTQYTSIFDDDNYKSAIQYADLLQKAVYEEEAKVINEIQKGILAISHNEEPFDVFICYKETDHNGRRTPDSVLANDLYHQLVQEGFKVFFARITLEDKLGSAYEPYIFAALNSAKVMVVLGTKSEYFNAVWVKNEWSRYLSLIKNGAKKMLIPAYKDMDPYDMPDEFSHLQAQDMSKLGFMQDLIRGIKKILDVEEKTVVKEIVSSEVNSSNLEAILMRANIFLEDGDWKKAEEYYERILDISPQCAEAYLGKFLVSKKICSIVELQKMYVSEQYKEKQVIACEENTDIIQNAIMNYEIKGFLGKKEIEELFSFDRTYSSPTISIQESKDRTIKSIGDERLLVRAKQFAQGDTKKIIEDFFESINRFYDQSITDSMLADEQMKEKIKLSYSNFLIEAEQKVREKYDKAFLKRDADYDALCEKLQKANDLEECYKIKSGLALFDGYKDSHCLIRQCQEKIERIQQEIQRKKKLEEERIALQIFEENQRKKQATKKMISKLLIMVLIGVVVFSGGYVIYEKIIVPQQIYNQATECAAKGEYIDAIELFQTIIEFKDSKDRVVILYNSLDVNSVESLDILKKYGCENEEIYQTILVNVIKSNVVNYSFEEKNNFFINYYLVINEAQNDKVAWNKYLVGIKALEEEEYNLARIQLADLSILDAEERWKEAAYKWIEKVLAENIGGQINEAYRVLVDFANEDYLDSKEMLNKLEKFPFFVSETPYYTEYSYYMFHHKSIKIDGFSIDELFKNKNFFDDFVQNMQIIINKNGVEEIINPTAITITKRSIIIDYSNFEYGKKHTIYIYSNNELVYEDYVRRE